MSALAIFLGIITLMLFYTNKNLQKERDFYKDEAINILKRSSMYKTYSVAEAELQRKFNGGKK